MAKFKSREEYEQWKASRLGLNTESGSRSIPAKKPVMILIVGWAFIIIACFMIIGGFGGLVMSFQIQMMGINFAEMEPVPDDMPLMISLFLFLIENMMFFSVLFILISVLILVSGIFFLMLKTWAKTSLEVFSWGTVIFIAFLGLLWILTWASASGTSTASSTLFGTVIGLIVTAFYAAIPVTFIVLLRQRSIKDAFGMN